MKRFLKHLAVFLVLVSGPCVIVFWQADGHTDPFYKKLTSPKQTSMIIGSSRAAQGLQPQAMEPILGQEIYNFSFSRIHTPYGKAYLEAIKKKCREVGQNNTFILEVNPWAIAKNIDKENKQIEIFPEEKSFLKKVKYINVNPNFEYLIKCYDNRFIEIFTHKNGNFHGDWLFVHDDGWFEVSLTEKQKKAKYRKKQTIESYDKLREEYRGKSEMRVSHLEKTIDYLKNFGQVYLVRLPIVPEMLRVEQEFMPSFDKEMSSLSRDHKVQYINLISTNREVQFTDGHHLDIESGKKISRQLAGLIKDFQKK